MLHFVRAAVQAAPRLCAHPAFFVTFHVAVVLAWLLLMFFLLPSFKKVSTAIVEFLRQLGSHSIP